MLSVQSYMNIKSIYDSILNRLQDEMNKRVAPDTTLTMYQMWYGAKNYPAGVTSGQKNALLITMREMIPDTTKIIIGEINDILLQPFKSK